jgi:hypothetical protein
LPASKVAGVLCWKALRGMAAFLFTRGKDGLHFLLKPLALSLKIRF